MRIRPQPRQFLLVVLVVGLLPLVVQGGAGAQTDPAAIPPQVSVPALPAGRFIRVSPAPDKLAVNLPVWLAVDPAVWRPLTSTSHMPPPTTSTAVAPAVPTEPPPATAPLPPTRVTVTLRPLYVDWDLGRGAKLRCYGPGRKYDPNLPLSTQAPDCTHTYRQPLQVTIKAAVTYGSVAVVEVPNEPPREQVLAARVARDELEVRVNELQAVDPGLPLSEMFPPGNQGGAPPSSAQVELPSDDEPSEAREGAYFPQKLPWYERAFGAVVNCFDGLTATCTKWTGVVLVAVGTFALCAATVGVGCAVAAIIIGSATYGAMFCKGESRVKCALKEGAIGALTVVGGGIIARIGGRLLAPVLARVGGRFAPVFSRLGAAALGLVPGALRTGARGVQRLLGGRVLAPLSTLAGRMRLGFLTRLTGLVTRLPGPFRRFASRPLTRMWVRLNPRLGLGGSHKTTRGLANQLAGGGEVNHMPASGSYAKLYSGPLSKGQLYDRGPTVWMEKADHTLTASYDWKPGAREWRARQHALIEKGRFREAVQMDVDDIRKKFGPKYDEAIKNMWKYIDESGFDKMFQASSSVAARP